MGGSWKGGPPPGTSPRHEKLSYQTIQLPQDDKDNHPRNISPHFKSRTRSRTTVIRPTLSFRYRENYRRKIFRISRELATFVRFMHIHELRASIVSIPFRVRTSLKVRIDESFRRLERKTKGWKV